MFGQSENCGLLSANIPKRYIKLGSTGKAVPGVKTKIIVNKEEEVLKTPMLEGGFSPEIGEVRTCVFLRPFLSYSSPSLISTYYIDIQWCLEGKLTSLNEIFCSWCYLLVATPSHPFFLTILYSKSQKKRLILLHVAKKGTHFNLTYVKQIN